MNTPVNYQWSCFDPEALAAEILVLAGTDLNNRNHPGGPTGVVGSGGALA
jgi:hypothetical protein